MDTIEKNLVENNQVIKNNSKRLDAICEEVKKIKNWCGSEPPLRNKGTKESSVATNDVNTPCDVITPAISPVFYGILNTRKLSYYNKIRNEGIATIYKGFLEKNPPFIPKKFREAGTPNDSEKQRERLDKLEVQKVTFEIERLKEQEEKHLEELENAELEIKEHISEQEDPTVRQLLKEKWYSQTKYEEDKSDGIWAKKQHFFEDLEHRTTQENQHNKHTGKRRTNYFNSESHGSQGLWRQMNGRGNYQNHFKQNRPKQNFSHPYNLRQNR